MSSGPDDAGRPSTRLSITLDVLDRTPSPGDLAALARAADDAGLDTVWVPDHLMQVAPGRPADAPVLEAYTLLGHLAAHTSRVRLGTMVTAVTYRPAALLIKAVTTLDALSGGRAWLGVGAGYARTEARALGLPLPSTSERFERLEETVELAHRLWSGDRSAYHGTRLHLDAPVAEPRPTSRPHPPVLIGGTGPRRTLPLVARLADAANFFDIPDGGTALRAAGDRLDRCCRELGRDPRSVERTVNSRLEIGETAEHLAERCTRLADLGADHVVLLRDEPWTPSDLAMLAEARLLLSDG